MQNIEDFLAHFKGVRKTGKAQWEAICPAHDDEKPSLSIGLDGDKVLIHCQAGCSADAILRAAGLRKSDLFLGSGKPDRKRIVATYDYNDEEGKLLFQVVRYTPKDFRQRRPNGDSWTWNLRGVKRVLYHLPEVLKADQVYIVEGEKDADRLSSLGVVATTCPGGAGKWRDEYGEVLRGREVLIIPDNDEPGRKHANEIAEALSGIAKVTKILNLSKVPPKGDVSDWLETRSLDELLTAQETITGSLEEARGTVAAWLNLEDLDIVNAVLSTVLANTAPGDPVWLLVVGPPASAKSELLRALGAVPEIYRISSLTGKTLLSGHKDAGGGLLFRIPNNATLMLLDFGQVLSLRSDEKAEVLQRLREVYDGYSKADFGNRADGLEWTGKLGFLAGVTHAIEKYTSVGAELGDRFLLYEIGVPDEDREDQGANALTESGQEAAMRADLAASFAGALSASGDPATVTADAGIIRDLASLADLSTRLRTPVSRNGYTKDLDYLPVPEGPARFAKALIRLAKASAALRGSPAIEAADMRIIAKVTIDCIPSRRLAILTALDELKEASTRRLSIKAGLSRSSTKVILEDLLLLKAVEREEIEDSGTLTTLWRIRAKVRMQWALAHNLRLNLGGDARSLKRHIYTSETVPSVL